MQISQVKGVLNEELYAQTGGLREVCSQLPCNSLNPQLLFDEVVAHIDELAKHKNIRFKLIYEKSGEKKVPFMDYMPEEQDGSFENYHSRITKKINTDPADRGRYQLVINCLERYSTPYRDWVREFYEPIYEKSGLPSGFVYTAPFIGDYKATTFGVHYDDEYVFVVPVIGSKKMLLWNSNLHPHEALVTQPGDPDKVTTALPGHCMFWPPNFWHVASSEGDALKVSVSLSITIHPNYYTLFLRHGHKLLLTKLKLALFNKTIKDKDTFAYSTWWTKVSKHIVDGNDVFSEPIPIKDIDSKKIATKKLAEYQTAKILRTKTKKIDPEKAVDYEYELNTNQQPLTYQIGGRTVVALNGHVYQDGNSVLELLKSLREQSRLKWPNGDEKMIKALLWLYKIRVISIVDDQS